MGFSNETPDEADERRLRAALRQAPIPDTPPAFTDLLGNRRRRRKKSVATLISVAAGILLALLLREYWIPRQGSITEDPYLSVVENSPFDPPPVDSLDLLTLDLSALEEIGKEDPQ